MNINNELLATIENNAFVIVGVSSGPDSMALLHLLQQLPLKIVVAHINHKKREASEEEYRFLEVYCYNHNIIFEGTSLTEELEGNFQHAAREFRYEFYRMLYLKYHAKALLTGHHGDDQTETILMRILRGTSLKGLIGIKDDTVFNSMRVIRPLLGCSKQEILEYLDKNQVEYRIDSSNLKSDYTRNYIRNEVIPVINKEFGNTHTKFQNLSANIEEVSNFIDEFALEYYFKKCEVKINWDYFGELHPFMQKEILRRALKDLYKSDINLINNTHIEDLVRVLSSDKKEYIYNLPNEIIMHKFLNSITFAKKREEKAYCFELEGEVIADNKHHFMIVDDAESDYIVIDPNEVSLPLSIRTRKAGDRMIPKGMTGHKKLGSIFIEAHISRHERSTYPIVVDNNDKILWIPKIKMSKYCKSIRENHFIVIKYKRIDFK